MPLLRKGQIIANDEWSVYSDDADLPENRQHAVVSLKRYLELQNDVQGTPSGLIVAPADDVLELSPYLPKAKADWNRFP